MKKLMKVFAIVFVFGVSGVTSGWYVNAKVVGAQERTQTVSANPCEDAECEPITLYCIDNPGGNTGCFFDGEECITYQC